MDADGATDVPFRVARLSAGASGTVLAGVRCRTAGGAGRGRTLSPRFADTSAGARSCALVRPSDACETARRPASDPAGATGRATPSRLIGRELPRAGCDRGRSLPGIRSPSRQIARGVVGAVGGGVDRPLRPWKVLHHEQV